MRRRRRRRRRSWMRRYGRILWIALCCGCVVVFILSATVLIRYGLDWLHAKQATKELATVYYATEAPTQAVATVEPSIPPLLDSAAPTQSPAPTATAAPISAAYLGDYPHNPNRTLDARIHKLQRQNQDIIGWLHIDDVLDEAVVQRDNQYYLRRDYKGYHNTNGALFLDQACDLRNRPLLYMVYGHNMKTGSMFGCLRNWENTSYYHNNPFIQWDTQYEKGQFVIFSVGVLSESMLAEGLHIYHTADVYYAQSLMTSLLRTLANSSLYTNHVDVTQDDQLLLLVTCTADDSERRVVAARRVRDGESLEELQKAVARSHKK